MSGDVVSLNPPSRVLMGPGPSDVPPSVLAALGGPTVGHLDPAFLKIMDQVRGMLRRVFNTTNELTVPMSGTGSAGMETCFVNLLEPGDNALIGVNGVFGTRMCEVAKRCGANVTCVEAPWGRALSLDDFRKAAAAGGGRFRVVAVVHAETSTGVLQDLTGFREFADEVGALLLVDAVTSLGGVPLEIDKLGIDAVYSGTQKCLSCPPGLSPVSFSPRAVDRIKNRHHPAQSWYLDLSLISQYWGQERVYHHTAPINMLYGIHEALRLVLEEGLEARWARHKLHAQALWAGLEAMGLKLAVPSAERLSPLTAVEIPPGVNDAAVRRHLLEPFGLEIGGGLGPMKGKVWRIGLMGHGCTRTNVTLCLSALASALRASGYRLAADALPVAEDVYNNS